MTPLVLPFALPMWEIGEVKITRAELRRLLGEPHFVETDGLRTFGGEEDWWAFQMGDGSRAVVSLRVPYGAAIVMSDPPESRWWLEDQGISVTDPRVSLYPEPFPVS